MPIFHLATRAGWEQAQTTGLYTTSTLGRSLADVGFIHAARGDQWEGVRERFYTDAEEPLVLLVIDTDALQVPVVDEADPATGESFPHIYGALPTSAVTRVIALDAKPDQLAQPAQPARPAQPATATTKKVDPKGDFGAYFMREVLKRGAIGFGVIVFAALVGEGLFHEAPEPWMKALASVLALLIASVAVWLVLRRRAPQDQPPQT